MIGYVFVRLGSPPPPPSACPLVWNSAYSHADCLSFSAAYYLFTYCHEFYLLFLLFVLCRFDYVSSRVVFSFCSLGKRSPRFFPLRKHLVHTCTGLFTFISCLRCTIQCDSVFFVLRSITFLFPEVFFHSRLIIAYINVRATATHNHIYICTILLDP